MKKKNKNAPNQSLLNAFNRFIFLSGLKIDNLGSYIKFE